MCCFTLFYTYGQATHTMMSKRRAAEFVFGSGNFLIAGLCYTCGYIFSGFKLRRAKFIAISQIAASPQLMRYSSLSARRGCEGQRLHAHIPPEGPSPLHRIDRCTQKIGANGVSGNLRSGNNGGGFVYFLSR